MCEQHGVITVFLKTAIPPCSGAWVLPCHLTLPPRVFSSASKYSSRSSISEDNLLLVLVSLLPNVLYLYLETFSLLALFIFGPKTIQATYSSSPEIPLKLTVILLSFLHILPPQHPKFQSMCVSFFEHWTLLFLYTFPAA